MLDSVSIKLGGVTYAIPRLDMGQIRWANACRANNEVEEVVALLQIFLQRAKPKPPHFDSIPFDFDEARLAVETVAKFSGLDWAAKA